LTEWHRREEAEGGKQSKSQRETGILSPALPTSPRGENNEKKLFNLLIQHEEKEDKA